MQLADGRTVTADEAYLRDCILLPDKDMVAGFPPLMPNFTGVGERGPDRRARGLSEIADHRRQTTEHEGASQ